MRKSFVATMLVAGLTLPVDGRAQSDPPAAPGGEASSAAPKPGDCSPRAALYQAGKGPKVWVLRQGTMVLAENPLRPLSRDEVVVLEVVVNGRRATAFGPDMDHLRQGGTPKSVEREGREPIRWAAAGAAPAAMRVVAEDGRVLLGPMSFGGCDDPPAAKEVAEKPVKPARPARAARKGKPAPAASDGPAPAHLPQGALPGMSMQKDAPRR